MGENESVLSAIE